MSEHQKILKDALTVYAKMQRNRIPEPAIAIQVIGDLLKVAEEMKADLLTFRTTLDFYQWRAIDLADTCLGLEAERDALQSQLSDDAGKDFTLDYAKINAVKYW